MMVLMMKFLLLTAFSGVLLNAADLAQVRTVYILPMASGLDQHLANRLTSNHVFQVVTDPKLAEAVFSDRIGPAFEQALTDLQPPPKVEAPAKAEKPPEDAKAAPAADIIPTVTENKLEDPSKRSSFGRSKGTVFLVDAKSHLVLWSVYEQPKGSGSNQLDSTATAIVSRLKSDLKKKK